MVKCHGGAYHHLLRQIQVYQLIPQVLLVPVAPQPAVRLALAVRRLVAALGLLQAVRQGPALVAQLLPELRRAWVSRRQTLASAPLEPAKLGQ
jgi:hypothetical protein